MTSFPSIHSTLDKVTQRVVTRSKDFRNCYLKNTKNALLSGVQRKALSCANLAHGFAAFSPDDKLTLKAERSPSIAIISAYNDMLSAHQPYERYPDLIRAAVHQAGGVAQFAGGVPAMCDGITQGQPGMELSLFSRDIIAMSTAIGLSHNMFDAVLYLGVCDKIVPGLLIGALHFGHLPAIFVPAGPMTSGLSNQEKAKARQLYAKGKIGRDELLEAESKSYHDAGTCTFYGTANSNQLLVEVMGLHLPGAAFVPPNTPLRDALSTAAAKRAVDISTISPHYTPISQVIDEKSIVNALVALMATGGSTNHTLHLVAIAKACGIIINWDDFGALSRVVPLLTRIYPNGQADINYFHAAGGTGLLIQELLSAGLLHNDVTTVIGKGLFAHCLEATLDENQVITWRNAPAQSADIDVLRCVSDPFSPDGGLVVLSGNLGRSVMKVSAVKPENRVVEAPAIVFHSQDEFSAAYKAKKLERDFIAVVRFQGPKANGMPELHNLTPALANLQDAGFKVAIVTDGRMSGASGKVPAAIHVCPEALDGGPLAKVREGDLLRLDPTKGTLDALVDPTQWEARSLEYINTINNTIGMGRELFGILRSAASSAETGATSFSLPQFL